MNPFETHGIQHLSPSSINLFVVEPAMWVLQYLYGHRSPSGAAAARGIAAEHGIAHGLFDPSAPVEHCIAIALKDYDKCTALASDSNREKERDGIPGMVEVALAELRQYGIPARPEGDRQHKIEVMLHGIPVPCIGYLDFDYPQHGIIVDLKTQLRLTSTISASHARQGAIYSKARGDNIDMRFAYATPKKVGVYQLMDVRDHLAAVETIAARIMRFLSISTDKHELASILAPNTESFYWSHRSSVAARKELYGY
jgi:hypothetical protein